MDSWVVTVLIWIVAAFTWWYCFCVWMQVRSLRKASKCFLDIIVVLNDLPEDIYIGDSLWDHTQDVISVYERMAEVHKADGAKWGKRSILNMVRS